MNSNPAVLVVDDEPRNRALLRAALAGVARVIEASSAEEAFAKLDGVELVLLDVMMPGTDGYDLCARIKRERADFLPVILVTALGEQADRNRGLEAGADDFLTKPIDRRELKLRVSAFLRLRAQDRVIRDQLEKLTKLQGAKDDLVSMLVHDLRSPLAAASAFLSLLVDGLEGQAQNDALQAQLSVDAALERVGDALQVRLIEEARLPLHPAEVRVGEVVAGAVAMIDAQARCKKVKIEADVAGAGTARVDPALLRRSVENLLANALKHTPAGGDVVVRARAGEGAVQIEIADRGPGVPEPLKAALFEKFASVEQRRGARRTGVGLGLYLVRLVAEGHGGNVSVADRPGGGALFRLALREAA